MNDVFDLMQFDFNRDKILEAINKVEIAEKHVFDHEHADSDFVFFYFLKIRKNEMMIVF